jgi:histidyl-tRNA synthetase
VGVNIAIEKIVSIVLKAEQVKSAGRRVNNRELWLPDTEVLIVSMGVAKNMLEERMAVAAELWAKTLRVEYLYPDKMTPDEIANEALGAGAFTLACP